MTSGMVTNFICKPPRPSRKRKAEPQPFLFLRKLTTEKLTTLSVRSFGLVHVHVLGVNHVTRLLLLRGARARRISASCRARRCTGLPCGLRRLIELLGDLVQRTLNVLLGRPQPWNAAFVDGFFGVFDG